MIGLLSLAAILCSCGARSTLDTEWVLPDPQVEPMEKLAVIGLMQEDASSKAFETSMASGLREKGIDATPGFAILNGEKEITREDMDRRISETEADGILMFRVIGVDESGHYVPPTTYISPTNRAIDWWDDPYWGYYNPYPSGYWEYWYPSVQVVSTPGYWETSKTYRIETVLYRASDGKLVWTAVSSTYDPETEVRMASSLSEVVAENLKEAGLVRG